jgi:hypothetical protein
MGDAKPISPVWKAAKPFVNGGLSGMLATCVMQPVDMVKVRLQLGEQGNPVRGEPMLGDAAILNLSVCLCHTVDLGWLPFQSTSRTQRPEYLRTPNQR